MSEKSTVYAVKHPHGYVKIGRSENPEKRLQGIQVGSPYELEILAAVETAAPKRLEETLHERFASDNKRGEWFRLSESQRRSLRTTLDLTPREIYERYHPDEEKRAKELRMRQALIG